MKKLIVLLLVLCGTVFGAPLRIGMELTYPPFETIDKKGNPAGISVELAKELGKYLKREVIIESIPFSGLIPSLKTDKIDLIISSITVTEDRKKVVAFSDPYLTIGLCLLVPINSSVNSIEEVRTVVVKLGTTGQTYAETHLKNAKLHILDKEASCVLEVVQGKADAFIYDQLSIYMNWQKNIKTTRALLNPFYTENWAIALRKEDEELKNQVNAFLKYFKESGGFEKLGDRYLGEQKEAFKKLGIPFYF